MAPNDFFLNAGSGGGGAGADGQLVLRRPPRFRLWRRSRRKRAELQPGDRLVADANTGWLMHDALRVVRAVRDIDVYIEQPCRTYEECLTVRRHCDHPFVLDENVDCGSESPACRALMSLLSN
jgi:L-alanine-DL-glutamate epimerase-like enolase superfamily enzyme